MLNINARSPARRSRGFTLIELMTVVTIIAILAALAAPSFREQIANFRIRSASEAIVNGLNLARAEAARRNTQVTFSLSGTGAGWSVAQVSPATTLQSRGDGSSVGTTASSSTTSLAVTFLPTGIVDTTASPRLERVTLGSALPGTSQRQIDILGGGLIRMCDPTVTAIGDPRVC
jgi:type IV fimbrial biogenesis protein FimT